MFSKFLSLDDEKKLRIMNAATKVFAQKGFQNASTNEIVKEAGISKGLLFHYFNNKKDLYLFLYDHYLNVFTDEIFANVNWQERDIFSKYHQVAIIKFQLFKQYPEMFNFIKAVFKEDSHEVKGELESRNKGLLASSYQKLFTDIDVTLFKEGVDIQKALNSIFWTLEGFANQQQEKFLLYSVDEIDISDVIAEMESYIELLRIAFYKNHKEEDGL